MSMYEQCLTRMEGRGSDNAFILYGVAILYASIDDDGDNGNDMVCFKDYTARAQAVEQRYQKRNETNTSLYLLANEIYKFVADQTQTGKSWHNYALCRLVDIEIV